MADLTGDVLVLTDGPKAARVSLVGDGGSGGVDTALLIEAAELHGAASDGTDRFMITSIRWSVQHGESALLSWDATAAVNAVALSGTGEWTNLRLKNKGGAGTTGDLLLTTTDGSTFTVIVTIYKYDGYDDTPNPRFGPPLD